MTQAETIKSALQSAASQLNTQEAGLEAQLLLQHLLNVNRAWLIAHADDALNAEDGQPNIHAAFEALITRRLNGEPIAYILGEREFFGLNLKVTPDTLIPRPDTETLVEAALTKIPQSDNSSQSSFPRKRESMLTLTPKIDSRFRGNDDRGSIEDNKQPIILDLGTGTGAIALAIAKNRPRAQVTAVDASAGALKIAKENAQNLQIPNVQFVLSHWFDALKNQTFDVIVSNPPYIEANDMHLSQGDVRFEPRSALVSGADGLDDIRQIIASAPPHLNPQGWLMLEHGYNQAKQVSTLLQKAGFSDIETMQDLGGNDRVTIGRMAST
jgi:release factor glutamine methyltransferase